MQFKRSNRRGHLAVETGALSDILFFLLLFFLIVATLASPNAIKLLLPKASTGKTIPKHIINVSVTANLDVYLDKELVGVDGLTPKLVTLATSKENPTVVLRCDKKVTVEEFIKVVDAVNKSRVPLVIATDKN